MNRLNREHRTLATHQRRHLGSRPLTPKLLALTAALEAVAEHGNAEERDDAERLAAAFLAHQNTRARVDQGYTGATPGWGKRGPGAHRDSYGLVHYDRDRNGAPRRASWIDHPYRLVAKGEPERSVYVAEPYGYSLDANAVRHMADLVSDGWDIHLDARLALHFPGRTIAITLKRDA